MYPSIYPDYHRIFNRILCQFIQIAPPVDGLTMEEVLKKITSSGPETDETIAQHLKCEEMREVAMEKCTQIDETKEL
ncbi:unnamed protein product [Aphanomyces euteiches]